MVFCTVVRSKGFFKGFLSYPNYWAKGKIMNKIFEFQENQKIGLDNPAKVGSIKGNLTYKDKNVRLKLSLLKYNK